MSFLVGDRQSNVNQSRLPNFISLTGELHASFKAMEKFRPNRLYLERPLNLSSTKSFEPIVITMEFLDFIIGEQRISMRWTLSLMKKLQLKSKVHRMLRPEIWPA